MFVMQIKVDKEWRSISRSDGFVYKYETELEAWRMLNMCYPDVSGDEKRVTNQI